MSVPPSAAKVNVETEKKDPDSIFNTYKQLLALRNTDPALRDGSYQAVNEDDPSVFAFLRRNGDATVLVALNMSAKPRTVKFNLETRGVHGSTVTPLYSSPSSNRGALRLGHIELPPFGVLVGAVQ